MKQLTVSQMIPFPVKLAAEGRSGAEGVKGVEAEYAEAKIRVVAQASAAMREWAYLARMTDVVESSKRALEKSLKVAESKYETGQGLQADVLRAGVELAKMDNELFMLEERRTTVQAKVNAFRNRASDHPLGLPTMDAYRPVVLSLEVLRARAAQHNPMVAMARAMADRMDAERQMAEAEWWPDLEISAAYGFRDPSLLGVSRSDVASAMVSINLPWLWGSQGDRARAKKAEWEETKAKLAGVESEVESQLGSMVAMLLQLQRTIALYDARVLPQARQALEQSETNYQVSKADFLTLLDNQMTVFRYEVDLLETTVMFYQRLAELQMIVGEPVGVQGVEP